MDRTSFLSEFRKTIHSFSPITDASWKLIGSIVRFQELAKGELLLQEGQVARDFHYLCKGVLRAYITDYEGNIYNKNLFLEGNFVGSKTSLLQQKPSKFTLEALEDSIIINMDYRRYKQLIREYQDLTDYYIAYLEQHWVIEKEQREVSLVMENATERYQKLFDNHPDIENRIEQRHIASHLGITPTQLSRIRKKLKNKG